MVKYLRSTGIILAGGQGKRMNSNIPKQFLEIHQKPILYYSLLAFEASNISEVILVIGKNEKEYCQKEILDKYCFKKVVALVDGGKERYHSVYHGLQAIQEADYVCIHDGARPLITKEIINHTLNQVKLDQACIVGMPVKDTIKIVDENKVVFDTPNRNEVWQVQTPQVLSYSLIKRAYDKLFQLEKDGMYIPITDDAMVVETMLHEPIHLIEGSYKNIKVTTPEDIKIAEALMD